MKKVKLELQGIQNAAHIEVEMNTDDCGRGRIGPTSIKARDQRFYQQGLGDSIAHVRSVSRAIAILVEYAESRQEDFARYTIRRTEVKS